jgi:hypothetical protein
MVAERAVAILSDQNKLIRVNISYTYTPLWFNIIARRCNTQAAAPDGKCSKPPEASDELLPTSVGYSEERPTSRSRSRAFSLWALPCRLGKTSKLGDRRGSNPRLSGPQSQSVSSSLSYSVRELCLFKPKTRLYPVRVSYCVRLCSIPTAATLLPLKLLVCSFAGVVRTYNTLLKLAKRETYR